MYSDAGGEVRRALQTLSVALVVDEDTSTVRPHQHTPPTPTAAIQGDQIRNKPLPLNQLKELRLASEDYEGIKDVGFTHLLLSHYRNQLLHWFVPEAMLALSLSLNGNNNAKIGKINFFSLFFFIQFDSLFPFSFAEIQSSSHSFILRASTTTKAS